VSGNGSLAYIPGAHGDVPTRLVWVSPDGRSTPLSRESALQQTPRLSPDGASAAVARRVDVLSRELWTYQLPDGAGRKWTSGGSDDHAPAWTPGGWLSFASNRGGSQGIYRAQALRPDAVETVVAESGAYVPASWSPGPEALAMYEVRDGQRDVFVVNGSGVPTLVAGTAADERSPMFSRDGKFLAYVSDGSGTNEIYLVPADDLGSARRATTGGGTEPVWGFDGTLYFRRGDAVLAATPGAAGEEALQNTRRVFERAVFTSDASANLPNYDVARDGRFLMLELAQRHTEIHLIQNWASAAASLSRARPRP
jgi:Tol biopolymer transport system component